MPVLLRLASHFSNDKKHRQKQRAHTHSAFVCVKRDTQASIATLVLHTTEMNLSVVSEVVYNRKCRKKNTSGTSNRAARNTKAVDEKTNELLGGEGAF